MSAADDDAPFSESMLQWLDEGDRMGEAVPGGAPRPSSAFHTHEARSRRARFFVGASVVLSGALVLALRLMGGHKTAGAADAVEPVMAAAPVTAPAPLAPPAPIARPASVAVVEAVPNLVSPPARVPARAAVSEPDRVAALSPAPAVPSSGQVAVAPAAPPPGRVAVARVVPAPAPVAVAPAAPAPVMAAAAPAVGATDAYERALADCRAQMTAGHVQHAVSSCRQAADARPSSSEALTLLAEAEFTRGHTGVALKLATAATDANQNFADAYVIIGGVYQEKGKSAEARAAYEQYLALQPRGKHAGDLRAILGSL